MSGRLLSMLILGLVRAIIFYVTQPKKHVAIGEHIMEPSLQRLALMNEYHSFLDLCQRKGLSFEVPTDDQLKAMSDLDLSKWVKQLRDLARTPTS